MGLQPKVGGILHQRLNTGGRPIVHKYREGKVKRTLRRESKVREIAERETFGVSVVLGISIDWATGRCTILGTVIDSWICGTVVEKSACLQVKS